MLAIAVVFASSFFYKKNKSALLMLPFCLLPAQTLRSQGYGVGFEIHWAPPAGVPARPAVVEVEGPSGDGAPCGLLRRIQAVCHLQELP